MSEMVERVARGMAAKLKAHCTNLRGECFAHGFDGPCQQEGGWPGEVDGEFDLEVLARAAIEAMAEPTDAMVEAAHVAEPNPVLGGYALEEDGPGTIWNAMIAAALKP